MRARKLSLTALAASLTLFSVGCAALPKSGPVNEVQIRAVDDSQLVQQAFGPVPGASPQRLINDFIRACAAGTYDDFQVARQFLTRAAAASWNPNEQVVVGSPGAQLRISAEKLLGNSDKTTVKASLRSQGTVDRIGVYEENERDFVQAFRLVRDDAGQWRIAELPAGIVIPAASFSTAYTRRDVYFLGPGETTLIPDPRFLPRRKLPTHLLLALLGGPSQALAPAVSTAFSAGTTLSTDGVNIQDGVVTVDLSANVADAAPRTQALMENQIQATFAEFSGAAGVSISANGSPILIKRHILAQQLDLQNVIGFSNGALIKQEPAGLIELLSKRIVSELGITQAAIAPVAKGPVALVGDQRHLYALEKQGSYPREIATGKKIGAPSVDRWGWIWASQQDPAEPVIVSDMNGNRVQVHLPHSDPLRELRVSPDGIHVAALAENAGSFALKLGVIVRDAKGRPEEISAIRSYDLGQNNFVQLEWVNSTQVAVFAAAATPLIRTIEVHGMTQELNAPGAATGLFCGGPDGILGVVTNSLVRQRLTGSVWREDGSGIQNPRLPG